MRAAYFSLAFVLVLAGCGRQPAEQPVVLRSNVDGTVVTEESAGHGVSFQVQMYGNDVDQPSYGLLVSGDDIEPVRLKVVQSIGISQVGQPVMLYQMMTDKLAQEVSAKRYPTLLVVMSSAKVYRLLR